MKSMVDKHPQYSNPAIEIAIEFEIADKEDGNERRFIN